MHKFVTNILPFSRKHRNAARLFFYLRGKSPHKVTDLCIKQLTKPLFTRRQVSTNLKFLIAIGLISPDNRGNYFFRGRKSIEDVFGVCLKDIPQDVFSSEKEWGDYICGLYVKSVARSVARIDEKERRRHVGVALKAERPVNASVVPVSLELMSMRNGKSASVNSRIRARAAKSGVVDVVPQIIPACNLGQISGYLQAMRFRAFIADEEGVAKARQLVWSAADKCLMIVLPSLIVF